MGFNGAGHQTRNAFHPSDLAALLFAQIGTARRDGRRVYCTGGGTSNAMSLAQLTAWCDERFGRHVPAVDATPRMYDIAWFTMDNSRETQDFGWRVELPLLTVLEAVAQHAQLHPQLLELNGA